MSSTKLLRWSYIQFQRKNLCDFSYYIVKRPQKVSLDSSKGRQDCLKCKPYTYVRYVLLFAASQVLKVT